MKRILTILIVLFSIWQILAQDTLFPKHAAVQFSKLLQGTDAEYAFATYDQIWEGVVLSGGEHGFDYPDIPGYGDHANEIYPLGSNGYEQEVHFKSKLLNPEQIVMTHRNLSFIECIQFDYGKSSPQRWFIDNLSPKWFAYTVLTHLTDSIFSRNPRDTVFHIPIRDAKVMYRYRKKVKKDSLPPNWDGYWRKNRTRYYWDYICFKDNDAGAGRGEFEIMAIKKIDTLTGVITVTRKIKNGKVQGRTIYGTPQSYSQGARLGYICHSNEISGSPGLMMNSYINRGDSLYEIEMMADGYDWIGACAQYVEEFMVPTAYTGYNPKTQRDTTIYLIDGVKLDVGGEEWKPYNFDRDGWPYYALDMNWDGKIDWVGVSQDSLLQSPDWDTLSEWLVRGNRLYAELVYDAAERHNRDFYISTNGALIHFPTYFNGRDYEDFNGQFQDTYKEALIRYIEMNKPGNVVDPMTVSVFERDRDSSKVGVHNFKEHRHIMALTTVLGEGAYGHTGDYSTHNKFMNSWQPNLGELNPEDWFDEFAVDSLGRSSKYLYPEGDALHRFKNRKWLGRALTGAIKLDSMYKPNQQLYAYTFIRYFEHGAVIYSQYHHKVKIQGNYKKILGVDPGNDGSIIQDSIEMLSGDGLFLVKIPDTRVAKFRKRPHLIFYGKNNNPRLLWQLDTAGICTLKWGIDTLCTEGSIVIDDYSEDYNYHYDFKNLNLDMKYYYKIVINDGDSKNGSFYTSVSTDKQEFSFLAFGDTRTNQIDQNRVFGRMNQSFTNDEKYQSFAISTGDFVSDGGDEKDWDKEFFNPAYPQIQYLLGNLPIQSVMGNHEKNGKLFKKYFPYDFEDGGYFTFEYGSALFIFLDQYLSNSGIAKELKWLEDQLKNTDKKWKFIVLHEPGYSAGGHKNNKNVQNYIQPLAVKYGVQIIFAGHNHYYARAEVDGVTHITTGGGGAPLYDPDNSKPYIVKAEKTFHFCKIDISDNSLHFEVVSDKNEMIDQFDIVLNTSSIDNSLNSKATKPSVTVFPNPFTNSIAFSSNDSNSKIKGVEIYNLSGQKIKTIPVFDNSDAIWNGKNNGGDYVKSGIYIYRIIFDKSVITGKIIRVGK